MLFVSTWPLISSTDIVKCSRFGGWVLISQPPNLLGLLWWSYCFKTGGWSLWGEILLYFHVRKKKIKERRKKKKGGRSCLQEFLHWQKAVRMGGGIWSLWREKKEKERLKLLHLYYWGRSSGPHAKGYFKIIIIKKKKSHYINSKSMFVTLYASNTFLRRTILSFNNNCFPKIFHILLHCHHMSILLGLTSYFQR